MAQVAQMAPLRTCLSPIFSSSVTPFNHSNPSSATRNAVLQTTTKKKRAGRLKVCCARASGGEGSRGGRQEQPQTSFPPPGELQYFGKLSASCVAGAVLVKYGSLCVPSVTIPNFNVAMVMISTPCLVSVVLLALASMFSKENARKQ